MSNRMQLVCSYDDSLRDIVKAFKTWCNNHLEKSKGVDATYPALITLWKEAQKTLKSKGNSQNLSPGRQLFVKDVRMIAYKTGLTIMRRYARYQSDILGGIEKDGYESMHRAKEEIIEKVKNTTREYSLGAFNHEYLTAVNPHYARLDAEAGKLKRVVGQELQMMSRMLYKLRGSDPDPVEDFQQALQQAFENLQQENRACRSEFVKATALWRARATPRPGPVSSSEPRANGTSRR